MPEATPGRSESYSRRWLFEKLGSFLLGDDIFISYSRADALNYSLALANQLGGRKFLSFVDQYGTSANEKLPPLLRLKVRRSTALVLVGTRGAAASEAVRQEIEEFRQTGRPIIPIDVDGSLARASWAHLLRGLPVSVEGHRGAVAPHTGARPAAAAAPAPDFIPESEERRRLGSPSPEVIARIESSFRYTRRNEWLRRMLFGGVAIILLSIGVVGWSANAAVESNLEATLAEVRSEMAAAAAAEAEKKVTEADLQLIEARRSIDRANDSRFIAEAMAQTAEGMRKDAERLQADAEAKAGLAEERERAATANALRQESIASSRRLVGQSISLLGSRPDLSFLLGASAFEAYPTLEARQNLLTMWRRYPRLSAVRQVHDYPLVRLAASPDGRFLASAGADGSQYLWDAAGRKPLACLAPPMKDFVSNDAIILLSLMKYNSVTFSPDGNLLAGFSLDGIQLFDAASGRKRGRLASGLGIIDTDDYLLTPDGLLIFASSEELYFGDIKDPDNPKLLSPSPFQNRIGKIALAPGGKLLAVAHRGDSGTAGDVITLFDIASRTMLPGTLVGHQGDVSDMAFAPGGGGRLLSLDEKGHLMLWDVEGRRRVGCSRLDLAGNLRAHEDKQHLDTMDPVNLAFNPAGSTIFVTLSSGNIYTWEVEDLSNCEDEHEPRHLAAFTPGVTSMTFAGEQTMVTGSSNGLLSFWETGYDHPLERIVSIPPTGTAILRKTISNDGRTAALAGAFGEVFIWDMDSGAAPVPLPGRHTAAVTRLEFSADGEVLAAAGPTKSGGKDMVVTLWDARSRRVQTRRVLYEQAKPLPEPWGANTHIPELREIRFSQGTRKRLMALVAYDGRVYVWDVGDPAAPKEILARETPVTSAVTFSRDGRWMATAGSEGRDVGLWDLWKSRPTFEPLPEAGGPVENMAFTGGTKTLFAVVGGEQEQLYAVKWDLTRRPVGRQAVVLTSFEDIFSAKPSNLVGSASSAYFSPDGTLLALASRNHVGLWDVETLTFLDLHESAQRSAVGVNFLNFDGSGSRLIMHDNDSISYRDISPALLLRGACRLAGRPLSGTERAVYLLGARERRACPEGAEPGRCPPPARLPGADERDGDPDDDPEP